MLNRIFSDLLSFTVYKLNNQFLKKQTSPLKQFVPLRS